MEETRREVEDGVGGEDGMDLGNFEIRTSPIYSLLLFIIPTIKNINISRVLCRTGPRGEVGGGGTVWRRFRGRVISHDLTKGSV